MGKLIDKEFAKQILSDLDKIRETLCEILVTEKVEKKDSDTEVCSCGKIISKGTPRCEKKEPRKMAEILKQANVGLLGDYYWDRLSKAAIDAVTQCYNLYISDYTNQRSRKSFPEYLKEKML